MTETIYVFDPDGEVTIVFPENDEPFAVWEGEETEPESQEKKTNKRKRPKSTQATSGPTKLPKSVQEPDESLEDPISIPDESPEYQNDINTTDSQTTTTKLFRIQVSAKHLILASPIFKKSLTGGWKETTTLAQKGSIEISTLSWDIEAFLILMSIFHCQHQDVPQQISLELLAKIAVIVDYYDCLAVVKIFSERWINALKRNFPVAYSRDSMLWVWVSWCFKSRTQYERSTTRAITESTKYITSLGLPIPEIIMDEMNDARNITISTFITALEQNIQRITNKDQDCPFGCGSSMAKAFTVQLQSRSLLSPTPMPPFEGLSYDNIREAVKEVRCLKKKSLRPDTRTYVANGHDCALSSVGFQLQMPTNMIHGMRPELL